MQSSFSSIVTHSDHHINNKSNSSQSSNHFYHQKRSSDESNKCIESNINIASKSPSDGHRSQHSTEKLTKVGCVNLNFKLGGNVASGSGMSGGGGGGGGGDGVTEACLSYDDSIDDSDGGGSVATTMTSSTYADNQSGRSRGVIKKSNAFRKCQSFHHTKTGCSGGSHASHPHHIRRIASGLRLAQSQAMAVAGFLPEYIEMQSTDSGGECRDRDYSDFDDRTTSTMLSKSCERNVGSAGSSCCGPGHLSTRASFHGRGLNLFSGVLYLVYSIVLIETKP